MSTLELLGKAYDLLYGLNYARTNKNLWPQPEHFVDIEHNAVWKDVADLLHELDTTRVAW